jgi:exoribonuclease R
VPSRHVSLKPKPPQATDAGDAAVLQSLADIRKEMEVPDEFPAEVLTEAEASARAPQLQHRDETAIPFVTIDPATSRDLDQAVHIERRGSGYRVHYAIADVAAYVAPGGAIDQETWRRVQTLYGPDRRTPLHPMVLSEDATSLLPDVVRPALLWHIDLDSAGQQRAASVRRSLVRSRAKLSYEDVQHRLDTDRADESLLLLREVGLLREEAERARGGLTLPVPEQQIVPNDGAWSLIFRGPLPVENWNAQISLLAGMAAASMMLDGKVGIIRTLPRADRRDIDRLRRMARALRVTWEEGLSYQDFVRSLDAPNASHAALLAETATLLPGAAYVAFDGTPPAETRHSAIAAPYAHTTAPLRRLVDRFVGETCVALSGDTDAPEWVRAALPLLRQTMADGGRRAGAYQRACIDLVEAAVLENRVGEEFQAVVVDIHETKPYGVVQVDDPAISGRILGDHLPLGIAVLVRLVEASIAHRKVIFDLVG